MKSQAPNIKNRTYGSWTLCHWTFIWHLGFGFLILESVSSFWIIAHDAAAVNNHHAFTQCVHHVLVVRC